MFRDAISKLSLRKKLTILALVGVFLPVLALTYMQYRSLVELENKTKGAFKDNLRQGFTILQRQLKQRLAQVAAQTLIPIGNIRLPPAANVEEIEKHFANVKRSHPEVEEIFAFTYSDGQQEAFLYSDKFVNIAQADFTPAQSHIVSVFDRSLTAQSFLDDDRNYLFTQDSCPACPPVMREATYLFYALEDQTKDQTKGQQRNFAGVLLNENFVRDDLIARTINALVAAHTPEVAITIKDNNQRVLYANAGAQDGYLFESNFDHPFTNWRGAINLKNTNLEDLARDSFLHSAGATILVLLFLLAGLALTLRATDREARLAQAKSNFVANVSHELKTPLSLLSLFSEILELGRVKSEEKKIEYYRIIRHESRRLNKMIDTSSTSQKLRPAEKRMSLWRVTWRK